MKYLVVTFFALLMAVPALADMVEDKGVGAPRAQANPTPSSVEPAPAPPAPIPEPPVPTATPAPTTTPSAQPEPVPVADTTEPLSSPGEPVSEGADLGYYDADGVWVPQAGFVGGCH